MNILDPKFKYVPAAKQNLSATFKRIRREQEAERKRVEAERLERIQRTVTPFRSR